MHSKFTGSATSDCDLNAAKKKKTKTEKSMTINCITRAKWETRRQLHAAIVAALPLHIYSYALHSIYNKYEYMCKVVLYATAFGIRIYLCIRHKTQNEQRRSTKWKRAKKVVNKIIVGRIIQSDCIATCARVHTTIWINILAGWAMIW